MTEIVLPYLLDCKPRVNNFFSSFCAAYNQGRLTIEGGWLFFISFSKCLDDTQSFLGYVLLTKRSFRIIFPHFSIMCTSVTGGIMMNRRQLQWCIYTSLPGLLIEHEACYIPHESISEA